MMRPLGPEERSIGVRVLTRKPLRSVYTNQPYYLLNFV